MLDGQMGTNYSPAKITNKQRFFTYFCTSDPFIFNAFFCNIFYKTTCHKNNVLYTSAYTTGENPATLAFEIIFKCSRVSV